MNEKPLARPKVLCFLALSVVLVLAQTSRAQPLVIAREKPAPLVSDHTQPAPVGPGSPFLLSRDPGELDPYAPRSDAARLRLANAAQLR